MRVTKRVIRYTKGNWNYGVKFLKVIGKVQLITCKVNLDIRDVFVELKEVRNCSSIHCRGIIYCCNDYCKASPSVKEDSR